MMMNNPSPLTTAPSPQPAPINTEIFLVSPFIVGDGKDFSIFTVSSTFKFEPGMILHNEVYDLISVRQVIELEDFWETLYTAECQLITNDAQDILDPKAKHMYYSHTEHND